MPDGAARRQAIGRGVRGRAAQTLDTGALSYRRLLDTVTLSRHAPCTLA